MKFSNVRLLVNDYKKCFKFYTEQLGLEPLWGDENGVYASFKVADGIEGLAIFVSDYMASFVGNVEKSQPIGFREKSLVVFEVVNVGDRYSNKLVGFHAASGNNVWYAAFLTLEDVSDIEMQRETVVS